ncbi:YtxH domain-containing protein [Paenibacillus swuensis]|uniref:YtxH domain-containing protein n=1 Tax=Paenibacillus swuensis TaxID=1178515 RepID=UPI000837E91B|nr:YtxH domain-containing protein [Paenibacillus swuensis]
MSTTKTSNGMMSGVIVGGLIGAAAALLFAPKKGTELRQDLMNSCSTLNDKTTELASNLSVKAKDIATNVSASAGTVAGTATDALTKAKELGQGALEEYKTWRTEQQSAGIDSAPETDTAPKSTPASVNTNNTTV